MFYGRFSLLEKVSKLGLASVAVLGERDILTSINQKIANKFEKNETNVSIFPNPFNNETVISFNLSQPSKITIKIYNLLGQEVASLITDRYYTEGDHRITFNGANLPSGAYFFNIIGEYFNERFKIVLMK